MRIIHTSDWHLGHTLKEKSREEEFEHFFSFLISTIEKERVEALLISGDIFDTNAPSSSSLSLYYRFLASLRDTYCKNVFVIAGNHDSPSVLSAPKKVLDMVNVHVYSTLDEIEPFVIEDKVIILPIPFPRDQELRRMVQGESVGEEEDRLRLAIESIYIRETEKALSLGLNLPIVAMGHLCAMGMDDEEKRDLYIGGLGTIDARKFPKELDYVALGHIHKSMNLNAQGTISYSGSPIPFSFKEAKYQKVLKLLELDGKRVSVKNIPIPTYRKLFSLSGGMEEILDSLRELIEKKEEGWVSLNLTESGVSSSLRSQAESITSSTGLEILVIKDTTVSQMLMEDEERVDSLEDLSEEDIFNRFLCEKEIHGEKKESLISLFREILHQINEGE